MRRLPFCLVLVAVLLLSAAPAQGGPIVIVSEQYSTQGCRWFCDPTLPGYYEFSESGTDSVYSPFSPSWATGSTLGAQFVVDSRIYAFDKGESLAEMVFRPLVSEAANILVEGWYTGADGRFSVGLSDASTGESLLDLQISFWGPHGQEGSQSVPLSFIAGREYALSVKAWSYGGDGAQARVTMPFTPAPDPGSTLLLLGIGVVGLGAWRGRRQ